MTSAARSIEELLASGELAAARDAATAAGDLCLASELTLYTEGAAAALPVADRALSDAADDGARARAHIARARILLRAHTEGALADARAALAEAHALGLATAGVAGVARYHKLVGIALARAGEADAALASFARGYDAADGEPAERARVLLAWAVQLRNWGLMEQAQRRAERSLELRLQLSDHYGAAMCYGVIAMICGRRGDHVGEREALSADLRICERIGTTADVPGLRARLAGALVSLGKLAAASDEARGAIEDREALGDSEPTDTHGYSYRELSRVALAQARADDAVDLAERGLSVFETIGNPYGAALCQLTLAEALLERCRAGHGDSLVPLREAVAAAGPVFARLGALPEAVDVYAIECAARVASGDGDAASIASDLSRAAMPILERAGLSGGPLARRLRERVHQMWPAAEFENSSIRAAQLRGLATELRASIGDGELDGAVVALAPADAGEARRFTVDATARGAIVGWALGSAFAAFVGDGSAAAAEGLRSAYPDSHAASGAIAVDAMWPAPARITGEAVERAVAAAAGEGAG